MKRTMSCHEGRAVGGVDVRVGRSAGEHTSSFPLGAPSLRSAVAEFEGRGRGRDALTRAVRGLDRTCTTKPQSRLTISVRLSVIVLNATRNYLGIAM